MVTLTARDFATLLAVVRLGDSDRLGWWRSHAMDETAEYALRESFPTTWLATGAELAMESARIRHDIALGRPTAIHLFSDYLPYHRLLRSWLIERKLERDLEPLDWLRGASVSELRERLGTPVTGDRRVDGMYLGGVNQEELVEDQQTGELLSRLAGAYTTLDEGFLAPYLDLVA